MRGIAKISFHGGALFMPMRTPYDRELLFEQVDLYARRHGSVRVELGHRELTVQNGAANEPVCAACQRRLDALTYILGGRNLCALCARRDVK